MKEKKQRKEKKEKKFNYFKAFCDMSAYAVEAAQLLDDSLKVFDKKDFATRIPDMRRLEHASDEVVYEVMSYVTTDFITPMDREDLIAITQGIDNVVDMIDEVFSFLYIYHVEQIRPDFLDITANIIRCTQALQNAVEEFSNFPKMKKAKEYIIAVSDLEKDSDDMNTRGLYNLFGDPDIPARDLLVWKNIYERLEDCADACEEVAHTIESAVLKNS